MYLSINIDCQKKKIKTMMAEVPPLPVAAIEEEDMHVCKISMLNNHISNSSTPALLHSMISPLKSLPTMLSDLSNDQSMKYSINSSELPFNYLDGEEYISHGIDLTDGIIYLTTYRLFIYINESNCSFINCPIRLIDSIEMKDNIYIYVQCKDIRSFRLKFFTTEKCCYWLRKLTESISIPMILENLFAIEFASNVFIDQHSSKDYLNNDLIRLQLDTYPWRLTEINKNYKLCTSYPEICVVPSTMTDEEITEVAKFRSYRRFPTIVWR